MATTDTQHAVWRQPAGRCKQWLCKCFVKQVITPEKTIFQIALFGKFQRNSKCFFVFGKIYGYLQPN